MESLSREKEVAIRLRKKGLSYSEILKKIPVAKSSLSLWLKDLPLTEKEKRYLKSRKDKNISRGRIKSASANRQNRLLREKVHFKLAKEDFTKLSKDLFFHLGICLYWAEGSKRDDSFSFINSDEDMVSFMVRWIESFLKIKRQDLEFRLFIHKPYAHENCEQHWADVLGIPKELFRKTIFKPTNLGYKKRPDYKGCIRIRASGIINLRKVKAWQDCLIDYYKKEY